MQSKEPITLTTMNLLSSHYSKYKRKSRMQGFTLIEILVAIVLLSFGLLGMVGIQALALKSNTDAKQQSTAVQMAGELSDMMRGNKNVAVATTAAANPYLITTMLALPMTYVSPTTPQCFSTTPQCITPLNVAQWEIEDWKTRISQQFAGAQVQICYDSAPYIAAGLPNAGLPQWGCDAVPAIGNPISIKIGWTRASTNSDRSTTAAKRDALDLAVRPSVVYSVSPGNPT